ncbi:hypothetical protein ABZ612_39885, partial [Streptomyces avermitilis]
MPHSIPQSSLSSRLAAQPVPAPAGSGRPATATLEVSPQARVAAQVRSALEAVFVVVEETRADTEALLAR